MHKITLDEALLALQTEIIIASSCDAKTHKSKDIKLKISTNNNRPTLKYSVRYLDKEQEEIFVFDFLDNAIDKYNDYHDI